jgi:hypothetical protein
MCVRFLLGKCYYKKALGSQNIGGEIILKRVLEKECVNLSLFLYITIGNDVIFSKVIHFASICI